MLEFRVLGSLEVVRDGATIDVPSRLQRALITRLLLSWGRVVPAADLVDALWEDAPPGRPRHALHVLVSRARALLGTALVTRAQGYALEVSKDAVDAERFEAAVRQAGSMAEGEPARAVDVLDDALGLWRGTPYGEFVDTFAQADVVRLEELRLVAQETLGEALLAVGALDRAVSGLSALVADHPLQERPHCLLMRALYLAGRQSEALAAYHGFSKRIRDELGLDPSPVLEQVHEEVLRQAAEPAGEGQVLGAAAPAAFSPAPASAPTPLTTLVGRSAELRRLATMVAECRIVTLVGTGGVGKTRLAQECAARVVGSSVWWVDLLPAREPTDVPFRGVGPGPDGCRPGRHFDCLPGGDRALEPDGQPHPAMGYLAQPAPGARARRPRRTGLHGARRAAVRSRAAPGGRGRRRGGRPDRRRCRSHETARRGPVHGGRPAWRPDELGRAGLSAAPRAAASR